MKKFVEWLINTSALTALVYLATFQGVQGAANVLYLWTGVCVVVAPLYLASVLRDAEVAVKAAADKSPLPPSLRWAVRLALVVTLTWFGFWGVAALWLTVWVLMELAHAVAKERVAAAKA